MAQLEAGQQAPDFTLTNQAGESWTLSTHAARGPVVLFFYPKNDTPVCIVEACSFRDQHEVFSRLGAQVVGVSSDDVQSHGRFAGKHELPYTLLADQGGEVRAQFGVKKTLGFFDGRVTFVIDQGRLIRHVFSSAFNAKGHVEAALETVRELAK